jgi:hypothetical protein
MDDICQETNRVTTECNHTFHTSCLMKSIAHNGFGCPYCRTKMVEEINDDYDSEYQDENEFAEELFDDNALTSFRMFTQRISGEEVEEEEEEEQEEQDQEEETTEPVPSPEFIAKRLTDQGVTMSQLVKCLLMNHDEYDTEAFEEDFNRVEGTIFGKLRVLISNYRPEQEENMFCSCGGSCRMCSN